MLEENYVHTLIQIYFCHLLSAQNLQLLEDVGMFALASPCQMANENDLTLKQLP